MQDPNAGPAMVGNACTQVNSVSVPRMSVLWTCGIAVQGDYACGGGMSPILSCSVYNTALRRSRRALVLTSLSLFSTAL